MAKKPAVVCASRGPRIGHEDTTARCKRPFKHRGAHRPDPEDGWGNLTWGDPVMPDIQMRAEWEHFGWAPTFTPFGDLADAS